MQLPALKPPKKIWMDIGKVAEGSILDNINRQAQADNSPIKPNSPLWAMYKREKGWTHGGKIKSLVAEKKRFIQGKGRSWKSEVIKKDGGVLVKPATSDLRNLVKYVQQKDYTGWFNLSSKGWLAVRKVLREWIKKEFRKVRAKNI